MLRPVPALLLVALAGCAAEPPRAPPLPAVQEYTSTPVTLDTSAIDVHGGNAQQLVSAGEVAPQWWKVLRSTSLDALVRRALESSPTLEGASAKMRQAQEELSLRTGATRFPKVDAKLSAYRVDVKPQSLGSPALPIATPFNLYLASVSVSYAFDLFGANRRELEALQAQVDHQHYEVEAARLALAGNVVTAAIREASLRDQMATTEHVIALQEHQLSILERLEQIGTVAHVDVVAQRVDLAQTRAQLPELRRQLEQVRHLLAVYVGEAPGTASLPEIRLADLELPSELPLTLPSELARRRPDIRAAEALLREAGARVGVATANLYPQIALTATAGSLTSRSGELFSNPNGFYVLGASLTQPLFHGGELQAKRRMAVAAYEQAGATYREVVLQGFQNVADVLRALEADATKLKERSDAAAHARTFQEITHARYGAGGVSYYALLDAQRRLQEALLDQTRAIADRYADTAALFQALGGGWSDQNEPAGAGESAH
jgi:NodT family efflux transporter outer membrane factor (OMF) lipoprotein